MKCFRVTSANILIECNFNERSLLCWAVYVHLYYLTGRLSALHLVVSSDGKRQTSWNWFLSPTLLSLAEFILLVSMKGLSLYISFLSKHFISENVCSSFFSCIGRPTPFDHIWATLPQKNEPPPPVTDSQQNVLSLFSVNLLGKVDMQRLQLLTLHNDNSDSSREVSANKTATASHIGTNTSHSSCVTSLLNHATVRYGHGKFLLMVDRDAIKFI